MDSSKIRFEFVVSGDSATFGVVRYRHPDHGERVEIQRRAYALYNRAGHKRYNYTPTEYTHQVVAVLGYLHRETFAWEPLPLEYAIAYNEQLREQDAQARARHPDYDWTGILPTPPIKGTAHYDMDSHRWVKVNLPD